VIQVSNYDKYNNIFESHGSNISKGVAGPDESESCSFNVYSTLTTETIKMNNFMYYIYP
jgi:hypothetical protein